MGFTENFNYCLEQRGYSAYKFSKIIGANIQSPINWKTGAVIPHRKTRQKIADHFGITLEELDGDELPVLPAESAQKNTRPAGTGRAGDKRTQRLLDFIDDCSAEELASLAQYIDFLESKRKQN